MQLCFGVQIGTEGFDLQLFRGAMDRHLGFLHSFVTGDFAKLHIYLIIIIIFRVLHILIFFVYYLQSRPTCNYVTCRI